MTVTDTTSVNTGERNDIVIQLQSLSAQKDLKELQFIGCPYHILDKVLLVTDYEL